MVTFNVPFQISGAHATSFIGVGLVIDAARGLVVCDRNTVPLTLGDVELCVAGSVLLRAKIRFLHPVHNFAILQYDPSLIDCPIRSAVLSQTELAPGNKVQYVGLSRRHTVLSQECTVTRKEPFFVSLDASPPRYAAQNVELIHLDRVSSGRGGVLVDPATGDIQALYASFCYYHGGNNKELFRGLPVSLMRWTVDHIRGRGGDGDEDDNDDGGLPTVYTLEVNFHLKSLAKARAGMGLTDAWVAKISAKHPHVRQVLQIARVLTCSLSDGKLRPGDLLLAVDGEACATFRDVELATRGKDAVAVTLLRDGQEETVSVPVTQLGSDDTSRLVQWSGMMLEPTYRAVPVHTGFLPEVVRASGGVYCSRWYIGSPAHMYGLRGTSWITKVNGQPTPDLDTFLQMVAKNNAGCGGGQGEAKGEGAEKEEEEFVRLTTIDLTGKEKVCTLQPDPVYWPSMDLRRDATTGVWTLHGEEGKKQDSAGQGEAETGDEA